MIHKQENIDHWMGQIFFFLLFLVFTTIYSNDGLIHHDSHVIIQPKLENTNSVGITAKPILVPDFDNSLVSCTCLNKEVSNFTFQKCFLNHLNENKLKTEKTIFLKIKPSLIRHTLLFLNTSNPNIYS